jgi:hypothetical protein
METSEGESCPSNSNVERAPEAIKIIENNIRVHYDYKKKIFWTGDHLMDWLQRGERGTNGPDGKAK